MWYSSGNDWSGQSFAMADSVKFSIDSGKDPEGLRGVRSAPVWLKIYFSEILNLIKFWYRIYPNKFVAHFTLHLIILKF